MSGTAADLREDLEALEMELLLEGVRKRYGYDLREFVPGVVLRTVRRRLAEERLPGPLALLERLLRDPAGLERLLSDLVAREGRMFEPEGFYRALDRKVVPYLRTYPSVRVWVMGCAGGEESYSLAVLLAERLPRTFRIYATDIHEILVRRAAGGEVPARDSEGVARRYRRAGGRKELSDWFRRSRGRLVPSPELRRRVVFASHVPGTDGPFNEFNLILGRGALGPLEEGLKGRVLELVHQSLRPLGFLALGGERDLDGSPHRAAYAAVDRRQGLYRKVLA